jgi:glycosyltransferase involved in cell wall biosynthesis
MGQALQVPIDLPVNLDGVEVYYFPSTFGPRSVWDSRVLVRKLKQNVRQYDIVYVSAVWQWLGYETTKICQTFRVPCVFGVHGSLDSRLLGRHRFRKRLYWWLVLQRTLGRATAIHFTTEYERLESLETAVTSFVVPNGLDLDEFSRVDSSVAVRLKYGIPANAPLVLSVGRIDPKKKLDLLISALSQNKEVYLVIVGPDDSPLARRYKQLSHKLRVDSRVIWTGYKAGKDLVEIYSAADAFALLSEDENFGMTVVEAMACGTPVLVSPYVGVWHEVKDADVGMAVDLDSQEVAQALLSLVHEPWIWKKRGQNARRVVQERFSIEKVADLMGRAFEDVLTGQRSPQCKWKVPVAVV